MWSKHLFLTFAKRLVLARGREVLRIGNLLHRKSSMHGSCPLNDGLSQLLSNSTYAHRRFAFKNRIPCLHRFQKSRLPFFCLFVFLSSNLRVISASHLIAPVSPDCIPAYSYNAKRYDVDEYFSCAVHRSYVMNLRGGFFSMPAGPCISGYPYRPAAPLAAYQWENRANVVLHVFTATFSELPLQEDMIQQYRTSMIAARFRRPPKLSRSVEVN